MALDMLTYLPDDILAKVDRAAMSVSLETRVPLLDHRVVEFAWRLPIEYKIRGGQTKWALRAGALPARPQGADRAAQDGLRGPDRRLAARPDARAGPKPCSTSARLEEEGYFRPEPIRRMWQAHLEGRSTSNTGFGSF